jgi:enamine deaminase RidA (YjgF/YER057c/UK114 family)
MREIWPVPDPLREIYAHSREARAGTRLLFISGQVGVAPDGSLAPDFGLQTEQAMTNVETLLAQARMTPADVVKLTYFVTSAADLPALGTIRRDRWSQAEPPAVTVLVVASLARPEWLIEIEAIAAVSAPTP